MARKFPRVLLKLRLQDFKSVSNAIYYCKPKSMPAYVPTGAAKHLFLVGGGTGGRVRLWFGTYWRGAGCGRPSQIAVLECYLSHLASINFEICKSVH